MGGGGVRVVTVHDLGTARPLRLIQRIAGDRLHKLAKGSSALRQSAPRVPYGATM